MGATEKGFGLLLIVLSVILLLTSAPVVFQSTSTATGGGMENATGASKTVFDIVPLAFSLFCIILLIAGVVMLF